MRAPKYTNNSETKATGDCERNKRTKPSQLQRKHAHAHAHAHMHDIAALTLEEDGALALGGTEGKLIKSQALATSLNNALAGSL